MGAGRADTHAPEAGSSADGPVTPGSRRGRMATTRSNLDNGTQKTADRRVGAPTGGTATRIGFVGLGHMGGNMAARFLAAGYTVYGEARDRGDADNLVHEGLQWRGTPREVAEAADVLITSVPDDGILESVASGADGILAG